MTVSDRWASDGEQQGRFKSVQLDVLPVLSRFWRLILAVTILCTLAAYGLSHLRSTLYRADAQMILSDPRNAGVFRDEARLVIDPVRYVSTQAELATSTPSLSGASDIIDGRLSVEELDSRVNARASRDLDLITISALDATPAGAQQIANAVSEAYQDLVAGEVQANANAAIAELERTRAELQAEIDDLEVAIAADSDNVSIRSERDAVVAEVISLDSRANQIAVDAALYGSGVQVFEPADLPNSPAQPRPLRNAAVGGFLGLLGATAYAWWLGQRRLVADSRHDAAPVLRAPLLGVVPDLARLGSTGKAPTLTEPASAGAETYNFVASSLEHTIVEQQAAVLLVTSPGPAEGKTQTALNLAVALGRGGRRVVLVDADERARGLSRWAQLNGAKGLTDLGNGVPIDQLGRHLVGPSGASLLVIPAGSAVDHAAGYFRSSGFRAALTALREQGDVIVMDSPPLLAVADASTVAASADGVVLVVEQGTPLHALEDSRDRIAAVGGRILGYVFNRAHRHSWGGGYYYHYSYGYPGDMRIEPVPLNT